MKGINKNLEKNLYKEDNGDEKDEDAHEKGKKFLADFFQEANIVRQSHRGGQGLEGNQCKKLLESTDKLKEKMLREDVLENGLQYIEAYKAFNKI